MKKVLMTALIASLLILPVHSAASSGAAGETPAPVQAQDFSPGSVPAEIGPAESMAPAIHALVLASLNHDAARFDLSDSELAWEGLYNMLSLYGQLDSRTEPQDGTLLLPAETVGDYAAALDLDVEGLGPVPAALGDRFTFSQADGLYRVVCGSDGLARLQVRETVRTAGGLRLTGALVYEVDGEELVQFQAGLQSRDNMFGYAITELTIVL